MFVLFCLPAQFDASLSPFTPQKYTKNDLAVVYWRFHDPAYSVLRGRCGKKKRVNAGKREKEKKNRNRKVLLLLLLRLHSQQLLQLGKLDRLGQKDIDPARLGLLLRLRASQPRQSDDVGPLEAVLLFKLADAARGLHAVHDRHADVHEDDVEAAAGGVGARAGEAGGFVGVEGFLAVFGFDVGVAVFFHEHDEELAVDLVVVY